MKADDIKPGMAVRLPPQIGRVVSFDGEKHGGQAVVKYRDAGGVAWTCRLLPSQLHQAPQPDALRRLREAVGVRSPSQAFPLTCGEVLDLLEPDHD